MTDTDFIRSVFCEVLGIQNSDFNEKLSYSNTEQWDSVRHMRIIAKLEQNYNIEFEMDEIIAMENVEKVRDIVKSKQNNNS